MQQHGPARSILYSLPPVAEYSLHVESLSSYVARLAEAHSVTVRTMVTTLVLPLVGRPHLQKSQDSGLTTFWRKDSRSVNGVARTARDWVSAMERLTLRTPLNRLTMLPLADLLAPTGLLKNGRAWCSTCLHEQRRAAAPIHEPLVWLLKDVGVCPAHATTLSALCPGCGRPVPTLAARSRPGFCPWCGGWLGASRAVESNTASARDIWVSREAGNLLALGQTTVLDVARLAVGIRACLRDSACGSAATFSREVGFPEDRIKTW